jgi:hypothetical protein
MYKSKKSGRKYEILGQIDARRSRQAPYRARQGRRPRQEMNMTAGLWRGYD